MKNNKGMKFVVVITLSVIFMLVELSLREMYHSVFAFTSLFFISLILMGYWFYQLVIPLALIYSGFFIISDYSVVGSMPFESLFRSIIMIIVSFVIYYFSRNLDRKNLDLEISKNNLKIENELLNFTFMSIGDGVISVDESGNVVRINKVAQHLTGWVYSSAVGKPFSDVFNIINEYSRETCENPIQKVLESGKMMGLANNTILIAKDGTERSIEDSAAPIRNKSGSICGAVLVFRDVTGERRKAREIEFLSYKDPLTELGNRRYWDEQLIRLDQEQFLPLSVIMGDVNGLKLTNDLFGHAEGDELLRKVADSLKSACRNDDIVCRYGGDEFTILLPNTDAIAAEKIMNRINLTVSEKRQNSIRISIALGWAVKKISEEDIHNVIKEAEDFMYKRKQFESPSTRGNIIKSIMHALNENSERERQHSERASCWCENTAKAFGLNGEEVEKYKIACELHDIGKIAINPMILDKTEKLTSEEWETIKQHPEIGFRILSAVPEYSEIAEYVLAHHERWDGKGYPKGLKGEEIPYIARIISIVDSYDAMISERPYKKSLSEEDAIKELISCSGSQFDPELVRCFLDKVLKVNM